MPRIAYVNGRYVPYSCAFIHVEDRGYQFSDGVYEVCLVDKACLVEMTAHLDRLEASLSALSIPLPVHRGSLVSIVREVVSQNKVFSGLVYIQVTRGIASRDHCFPSGNISPCLVVTARKMLHANQFPLQLAKGVKVITVPENRWCRVDIKSISLLANVLSREQAKKQGAQEAWFVDQEGFITEGAATNSWILTHDGVLVTRPVDGRILAGVTRKRLFDAARKLNLQIEERPFSVQEALSAQEAFMTASTIVLMPIVKINSTSIGKGKPGEISLLLRNLFFEVAEKIRA